jgi:hypothetical protein
MRQDNASGHDIEPIERRKASSGLVDYSSPIVLYESSKSKIALIPYFIQHSDHSELKVKIQTLKKADPPFSWVECEEKSLSLNGQATGRLLYELNRLQAVSDENELGSYIVLRIGSGEIDLHGRDPEEVAKALIGVLGEKTIADHLSGVELGPRLAQALRYSVRLEEMKSAMIELHSHLDAGDNEESIYQRWCENHPWSFGNQFVVTDEIRNISIQDQVDMLIPRINAGFRDIIELKRPNMEVLKFDSGHHDYYFSHDASMAIGQCHRYLDVFSEAASKGLMGHEDILAYHPTATIVIGRSKGWDDQQKRALHGLNSRLNDIRIITYDYLLAQGDSLVDYLSSETNGNI